MKRITETYPSSSRILLQDVPISVQDFKVVKIAADKERVPVEIMVARIVKDWCNGDKRQGK